VLAVGTLLDHAEYSLAEPENAEAIEQYAGDSELTAKDRIATEQTNTDQDHARKNTAHHATPFLDRRRSMSMRENCGNTQAVLAGRAPMLLV
jgi:hypothetical protein